MLAFALFTSLCQIGRYDVCSVYKCVCILVQVPNTGQNKAMFLGPSLLYTMSFDLTTPLPIAMPTTYLS